MGGVESRGRFLMAADYPRLEASFVREVKAIRERESFEPLLILVSSKLLGLHLRRLLAEEGLSHFNLRFWTLEEFAREISAPNFLAQGKRELPLYADELIIEDLAKSLATKTEEFYFRDIADRPGFHKAISATIKDLKDGCLLPDDLERFLSDTKLSKQVHLSKLRDLLKLWKGYQERLEAIKGYDQSDLMVYAAQWVEEFLFLKQTPKILIYGFYDFNTAQKRLLRACFTLKETTAFLPYEPTSAFEYVKPIFAWLKEAGFKEIEPARLAIPVRSQSLDHLSSHLFGDHKPFEYEPKGMEVISAPGEAREVRELVRAILQESVKEGIPFHEIGILLRAPEEYGRLFRETFHSLGIDPYIREGIPLVETRAGRSLKLLLSVIHQNFSRSSVMEFTTFAKLRRELFSNERDFEKNLARWDAISIRAGIVEGEEEWTERLQRLKLDWLKKLHSEEEEEGKRRFHKEDLSSLDQLIQFVQKLFRFARQVVGANTWRLKIEALIHTFDELVEEDEESLLVKQTIRSLSELDVLRITPSQEDFLRLVNQILEERVIPHGRFQRKGPTIVHLMAARGVPFKMVILPGMVEKSFPPLIRQDAILLDQERMAINRFLSGGKNEPLPLKAEGRLREERLLFRLAVGSARDKLILSYPRIETGTGKERLPSSFLLSLIKALTGKSVDFNQIEAFPKFRRIPLSEMATKRPEEAIDEVEFDLSFGQEKLSTKNAQHLLYLGKISPFFGKGLRLEYSRWGKRGFTHYDGFLDSEESRQILRDHYSILKRCISPTRLETYASCPFQYFLSGILGIEGLTEPEKETTISPLDKGKLLHDLLYTFYSELKKERGRSFRFIPEDLKRLIEIAEKKFLEFEETGVIGYPMFWEVEKREMVEQLRDFFNEELQESEYLPAYFEVRYGMKAFDFSESEISTEQPLSLPIKGEIIHLRGRIDRIDLTRDGKKARVRDYKTGRVSARANDFQGGRTLQLPLYLYAARQLLNPLYEGIRVEIAEYCFLRERRRVQFEESKLNEKEGELQEILETLARGIENGIFIAVPDNQGCKYRSCDFKTICATWTPILYNRKVNDPKVKRFLEVTRQLVEEAEE
jgi:ATP-dependent helicase/DNAse subunit B